jgi:hypothetical protein
MRKESKIEGKKWKRRKLTRTLLAVPKESNTTGGFLVAWRKDILIQAKNIRHRQYCSD